MLCAGKEVFPTYEGANRICERSRRRHEIALAPYRCEECGKWHVGSTIRKKKNRKRQEVYETAE